jgi:uncharacterized protein (TIGR02646 family)
MRPIQKGSEPASLRRHRASKFATYANYLDGDALRDALTKEQRGLCCYCMSRISTSMGMRVDHWQSQSEFQGKQLDYSNLLGVCMGNQGQPYRSQHCDTRKGKRPLSRNPARPDHAIDAVIRFEFDGCVVSTDPAFDTELNEVLNLNLAFLKNNRKAVLDAFKTTLSKGAMSDATVERHLKKWNGESHAGDLEPFCQVVVYWLGKRLRR